VAVSGPLVYAVIVLTPMLLAWRLAPHTDENFLRELGKMFALTAAPLLLLQAVLAARLRAVSRPYGLDMVMRFHKGMGTLAVLMLLAHPVLIDLSDGQWGLITRLIQPWHVVLGKLALLLLVTQAVTSHLQRRWLGFQTWRRLHQAAPVIWGFALLHSLSMEGDLELLPVRVLWIAAGATAYGFYLYRKVILPRRQRRRAWEVTDVRQETHDVWTLTFQPPPGVAHFTYWPGQFRFVSLLRPGRPFSGEEHHFTISSSPTTPGVHTSTIKESGDFTRTIGQTRPGDKALIEGPYGRFSQALYPHQRDLVFIAGGIGITPLMSMLRTLRDTQADVDVLLLYGNKTEADIVFREELAQMAAGAARLRVVHVLSHAGTDWEGETGYVDREKIERHCGAVAGKAFHLCGPAAMMDMLRGALRELRVPASHIHAERFYL
jgi:predicted ferric reductase